MMEVFSEHELAFHKEFCYISSFSSSCSVIVRVSVVLKRTVGDSD